MSTAGPPADATRPAALPPGPVFGVCGWSKSGKTTLLEAVIPVLTARGLRVAVVKNDVHGLHVDHQGKDSDRLYRAGASVVVHGPTEALHRLHRGGEEDLAAVLAALLGENDLVLVEGHKSAPVPKLWLASDADPAPPAGVGGVLAVLSRTDDRPRRLLEVLDGWLPAAWRRVPVLGGLLVGGASSRMGTPKQLLAHGGVTLLEVALAALAGPVERVVLLGDGPLPDACAGLPRLSDPPGLTGPLAGMLAAQRWAPSAAWLVCACDLPDLARPAVEWLLAQRRPGCWAVMPRTAGGIEPLLALYEPQARVLLERLAASGRHAPRALADHPSVATPAPPPELARCWRNANTPEDLAPG